MSDKCKDAKTCRYARGIYCVCSICWDEVGRLDGILPDESTADAGSAFTHASLKQSYDTTTKEK